MKRSREEDKEESERNSNGKKENNELETSSAVISKNSLAKSDSILSLFKCDSGMKALK